MGTQAGGQGLGGERAGDGRGNGGGRPGNQVEGSGREHTSFIATVPTPLNAAEAKEQRAERLAARRADIERKRLRKRKGRRSTILTSTQGVPFGLDGRSLLT